MNNFFLKLIVNNLKAILVILILIFPYILIYRAFFYQIPLSWGDAPYFYHENLKELFDIPILWDFRNANFGAPQAGILWLYLPTFLFGLFHQFFGLNHDILIRLIFYFPATTISLIGSFYFIGLVVKEFKARLLGSFLFGFNTYFLMVLDGGQLGIGLAYGLFPLVSLTVVRYLSWLTIKNYFFSVISLFLILNVDLRIGIIAITFSILWYFFIAEKDLNKSIIIKKIGYAFILISVTLLLNSFWTIPFVINEGQFPGGRFTEVVQINNLISLMDALFLYQPHFPINDFGNIYPPPFYFSLLPMFLLLPGIKNPIKIKISLLFLVLSFLAKGQNYPFGEMYSFFVNKIPFSQAFRDSTKFYIPLILTGSTLFSLSAQIIFNSANKIRPLLFISMFIYLLLLVHPAILGNLTGALSIKNPNPSFFDIYQKIKDEKFYRTIWFPETPPLAFSSINHPAIYANRLYQERPFASLIDGDYDLFGFLNSPFFDDWASLSGAKYLFFPENERKKVWSENEVRERNIFTKFISKLENFESLNWNLSFPGYKSKLEAKPLVFGQTKNFLVIGGEDIYFKLLKSRKFDLGNNGFLFAEGCQINLKQIKNFDKDSLQIVYFEKEKKDFVMAFLCNKLLDFESVSYNQWAYRKTEQYLKWKSELLEKGIRIYEYDFGKGIFFSTIDNEKITFKTKIISADEYYLPIRYTNSTDSAGIIVNLEDKSNKLKNENNNFFKWDILGPFNLSPGNQKIEVINTGGLAVINTLGLISKSDFQKALNEAEEIDNTFQSFDFTNQPDEFISALDQSYIKIDYQQTNPTQINLQIPSMTKWIIFTDHYDSDWNLIINGSDFKSIPVYSIFNGFYIPNKSFTGSAKLYYAPQKFILPSLQISLISLILLSLLIIFTSNKKK